LTLFGFLFILIFIGAILIHFIITIRSYIALGKRIIKKRFERLLKQEYYQKNYYWIKYYWILYISLIRIGRKIFIIFEKKNFFYNNLLLNNYIISYDFWKFIDRRINSGERNIFIKWRYNENYYLLGLLIFRIGIVLIIIANFFNIFFITHRIKNYFNK